jgi:hypothetical protein
MQLLEAEKLRLNNLRDRASEKGHRKEYPFTIYFFCQYAKLWVLNNAYLILDSTTIDHSYVKCLLTNISLYKISH